MAISTLSYIASTAIVIPLIIAIKQRKYLSKELKILFLYLVIAVITEVLGNVWYILHKSNHFIINAFVIIEFVLISLMFHQVFIGKNLKRIILIATSIYTLTCIYTFTVLEGFQTFNSTLSTIACLLIIIWVFIYFYQLLQKLEVKKLTVIPMFWISVGCLFYFSGTLFVFLYSDLIVFQKELKFYKQLWNIYYVLLFIFRILLGIGLCFSKTPLQLKPLSK